jgi:signal transduction histidine kinase
MPIVVMVLDHQRRIVLANAKAVEVTRRQAQELTGLRLGEALDCIHARETPGGCGSTEFCAWCGALRAVKSGLANVSGQAECAMLRLGQYGLEGLDLRVIVKPMDLDGHILALVTIQDVSHEKRRRTLERLFFHDVLNTAGGLRGLMELLCLDIPDKLRDKAKFIHETLSHLVDEILFHKVVMAAENEELSVSPTVLEAREILAQAAALGSGHGRGIEVAVDPGSPMIEFVSDQTLVKRILINLVKNAVEASLPGQTVTLGCDLEKNRVALWVRNPAVMDQETRMRVFTRGFSSKNQGRGLGTYGARLLAERYLEGQVRCRSQAPEGTTFTILLPLEPRRL